jgi:hypothetical protein
LLSGRPTALKTDELAQDRPEINVERQLSKDLIEPDKMWEMEIYFGFVRLIAVASRLTNETHLLVSVSMTSAFLHLMANDDELLGWKPNLPQSVKWKAESISKSPPSYFLLQ